MGETVMNEKDFEVLRTLNETRNITRAAEKLYITQSALSKKIKLLERELNVTLAIRTKQGIRFTPEGETVLSYVTNAEKTLREMRCRLDSMQDEICGTLSAGISINFARYRLPDVLDEYCKKYPLVHMQLQTGQSRDLYRNLAGGSIDVAILRGEYSWDGMKYLLSEEPICVVYSDIYRNKPLRDIPYISHKTDLSQAAYIRRWLDQNGLDPGSASFSVDNVSTCLDMVKRGVGFALLPQICLDSFHGIIQPCTFKNGQPFTRKTYIFCQKEALDLPQIAAFVSVLKKSKR